MTTQTNNTTTSDALKAKASEFVTDLAAQMTAHKDQTLEAMTAKIEAVGKNIPAAVFHALLRKSRVMFRFGPGGIDIALNRYTALKIRDDSKGEGRLILKSNYTPTLEAALAWFKDRGVEPIAQIVGKSQFGFIAFLAGEAAVLLDELTTGLSTGAVTFPVSETHASAVVAEQAANQPEATPEGSGGGDESDPEDDDGDKDDDGDDGS